MTKFWVRVVLRLLGLMVVVSGVTVAVGRMLPHGDHLLYIRNVVIDDNPQGQVYLLDINHRFNRLLAVGERDSEAVWSPDGNSIAFAENSFSDYSTLSIMDVNGKHKVSYPLSYFGVATLAWSPDGAYLAFQMSADDHPSIGILNVASGEINLISREGTIDSRLEWLPDGERLVYIDYIENKLLLFGVTCSTAGCETESHVIMESLPLAEAPQWSPDGQQMIVLQEVENGDNQFYSWDLVCSDLYEPDCFQNPTPIHEEPYGRMQARDASLSSDARHMVFRFSSPDFFSEIIQMIDVATGQQQEIGEFSEDVAEFSWSPDGTRLAYLHRVEGGAGTINILDVNSGSQVVINGDYSSIHNLAWRP